MSAAHAATLAEGGTRQAVSPLAISLFLAFAAITLLITWRAATRKKGREDFYTAAAASRPCRTAWPWLATSSRPPLSSA